MLRKTLLPVLLATLWVSLNEFFRNEWLFKSAWVAHYENLGLTFPDAPVNGAIWGLWSLLFAIAVRILVPRFPFVQAGLLAWFVGFVLMWVVVGNLGVLPFKVLYIAVPWSLIEVFGAVFIVDRSMGEKAPEA